MSAKKNEGRKGRPLGPYRTIPNHDLGQAVRNERSACYEAALANCVSKSINERRLPCGKCPACETAKEIALRFTVVPGHSKSCPLSQPRPAIGVELGIPDDARCCCRAGEKKGSAP